MKLIDIVHGSISPDTIHLLTNDEDFSKVVITDFGIDEDLPLAKKADEYSIGVLIYCLS
jgi:hypothetical protein